LQGNGTVVGNLVNSALVNGGINEQPGTLTVNGNFTNTGAGSLASYLSGSPSNTQVTVGNGNAVTLQGGTISGTPVNGLTYAAGQTFTAMNFQPGNLTGLFAGVANGTGAPTPGTSTNLGGGLTFGVVYNDHAGNIQLQIVNTPASTVDVWNGGTGTWAIAGDWSAGVPQFYSDVTVGATASGNVTLGQDATIESLAINSGNTLQYQAPMPQTLSVGGNVAVNLGGELSLPTSGDKLALGGNFSNAGTTTLGAGASLYGLGTFTNNATASVGNGAAVTTLGAASNQTGAQLTLAGGTLTAPSFANGGTTSGFGTIVTAIANTGLVEASGGVLLAQNGIQGATGNVTVDSGAGLDLSHATGGGSAATLAQNGNLTLGGNSFTVSTDYTNANFGGGNSFNKRAGVTGSAPILAAGNVAQAVTGSQITGDASATPTLALGNVHVGSSTSATYAIENTGTSGPSLRGAIQTGVNGGNITDAALSGSGVTAQNFGPIATGAGTGSYTVAYAPTTAGLLSGQAVHVANNFGNVGEQTIGITAAAYALASPTVTSSLSPQFNFGVVQVGQTYTDPLTITNTLVASAAYQEGLNASFGTPSTSFLTTNSGSITNLAAGTSNNSSMVVSLKPTSTGTVGGTVPISFASNGATTSGLGMTQLTGQNLDYSWNFSGTVVNPANPSITPTSVDFGNVRIGTTQQQALGLTNTAGAPPQASLDAQLTASGAATSNGGTISLLAPGSTDNTSLVAGLNTANAGAQSGAASVALQSDSTPNGCTSNCIVDLTTQNIAVKGNVYRLANPLLSTPSVSLAARVGDTAPSRTISITNSSPDVYTEGLKAGFGATSSPFTASGSIADLAAQGNSTAMNVALGTGAAGSYSGTSGINYTSTGAGTDDAPDISVGSGNVNLSGKVYTAAVATVATASPVDFGIIHVGDFGGGESQSVTVQNGATATALNDVLTGSISAGGAPFSGSGTLGAGLGAQQSSSALQLNLDTNTAGIFTGAANLALASHDPDLADLPLTTSPLSLKAQINRYAALSFQQQGGLGSLSGGGASYNLDFGNVLQDSTSPRSLLSILNDNPLSDQAFTDLLSSRASILSGSGFSFTGDSLSDLAGGDSQSGFDVDFDTANLGSVDEVLSFDIESSNASGYDQAIGAVTLNLEGDIVSTAPVPEPSTIPLIASGLGMLFLVVRRQRRGR
ncbi:MAG: choice-of-anchor D domain-containing protein, partial [Stellaceae bacterium]